MKLTASTAKIKVTRKGNFSHFENENGDRKNSTTVELYGLFGRGFEDILCVIEITSDNDLVCYPDDTTVQEIMDDYNWEKFYNTILDDAIGHGDPNNLDFGYGTEGYIPILKGEAEVSETEEEVKETLIGDFKTKNKFLNFISATSIRGQNVRFNSNFAFIKGKFLSGMLEDAVFKLTICDEGVNFEEVEGTTLSDESMRKRLISDIDQHDITGYAQKFVLNGLEFRDEDDNLCYLEVEHKKPIDLLRSIFDEEDQKEEGMKEISEKGLSALDLLFSDEVSEVEVSETEEEVEVSETEEVEETTSNSLSYLQESFNKMNESKLKELESRIYDTNNEIRKSKMEIKNAETKLNKSNEELDVLETRLDNMKPTDEKNGYVFFVSEEKKHDTGLDESTKHIADKIADIMKLKKDVLFDMLTETYHVIKLAKKDSDYSLDLGSISTKDKSKEEIEELVRQVSELDTMYSLLTKIDRNGKFTKTDDGIEYRGELNWHQLVSKLIKKGFEQDHLFDKVSGSNSYVNTTEEYYEETEEDVTESDEVTDEDFKDLDNTVLYVEYHTQNLLTYDEPTDIVFWSAPDIADENSELNITDDFAELKIRVGGKESNDISLETAGFVSATTYQKYEDFIKKYGTEQLGGTSAILIPNFKGEIRVGVELDKGGYAKDFDTSEFLYHTEGGGEPFLDFPKGTEIVDIDEDHDLSKLKGFLRDKKIDSVIN